MLDKCLKRVYSISIQTSKTRVTRTTGRTKTMFTKRTITNENMTVRDARDFLSYLDYVDRFAYKDRYHDADFEGETTDVSYNSASELVDEYNVLVDLIVERFGGAVGKVDFRALENSNSSEINQMIDNYLLDETA